MSKSLIKLIAINLVLVILFSLPVGIANAAGINITGYKKLNEGENSYVTHKSYFSPTSTNYYNIVVATPEWLKVYDADTGDEVTSIKSGNFSGVYLWGIEVGGVYPLEQGKNYVVDFNNNYELAVYVTNMNYKQVSTGESYIGKDTAYFKPNYSGYFHVVVSTPEELSLYEIGSDKKVKPLIEGNQCGYTFDHSSTTWTSGNVYYLEKGVPYIIDAFGEYNDVYISRPKYIQAPNIANESKAGVYYIATPESCSVYAYNATIMDKDGNAPSHDGNLYFLEGWEAHRETQEYLVKINKAETYGGQQVLAPGFVMGRAYYEDDFVVRMTSGGTYDLYDYLGDDDNVEVPNNFNGKPVTVVQSAAFSKRDFNSIVLPDSLETIKCEAFADVTNVNYLGIDEHTSVIEPNAFDTYNIKHIYFGNTQSYWGNICESNVNCTVHYEATYWDGYFTGYESEEKCYVTDYECDYCNNANFTRDLGDGTKHDTKIVNVIYNPNCNEEGYAYVKCKLCDIEFYKELPKSEHSFGITDSYVMASEATCKSKRINYVKCDNCTAVSDTLTIEVGEFADHKYETYVYNNDATCKADGTETSKCKWCDMTVTRTAVGSKSSHKFENYVSDNNATCKANATETSKCKWCEESDTREIANSKVAHKFGEYKSDNNATCCKDGTETAKCIWCEESDTREIANSKTSHKFGEYKADNNATCCKDGTETAKCIWCDVTDTKTVADSALGHTDSSKVFKDVKAGKWYTDAINYNYTHKYVSGVASNEFGLNVPVTRGMFITILARIAGADTSNNNVKTKFSDVASGKYYTAAIKWASETGVVNGITETTFEPNTAIQRQQLCVMIVNFSNLIALDLKPAESEIVFKDASSIAKYAKNAVKTAQMADIVNGYAVNGGFEFRPKNTATRAEAAQIIYKFHSDIMAK